MNDQKILRSCKIFFTNVARKKPAKAESSRRTKAKFENARGINVQKLRIMKKLYLLSGLGADKRVFDFLDLSSYNVSFLDWIDPLEDESMEAYARRLSAHLEGKRPILVGISFGGMIAIEIGKLMQTERIIIISSAKTRKSIRTSYIGRKLQLHRRIPPRLLLTPNKIIFWLFGIQSKSEKALFSAIMKDTDVRFFQWAIDKIMHWQNEIVPDNTIHIHGSKDRVIPFTSADYKIEGGGHLMVINRAAEISKLLSEIIQG